MANCNTGYSWQIVTLVTVGKCRRFANYSKEKPFFKAAEKLQPLKGKKEGKEEGAKLQRKEVSDEVQGGVKLN